VNDWNRFLTQPAGLDGLTVSQPVQLALMLGATSFIPAAIMTLTCFPRVIIVLSFVRQGLATQQVPPNTVLTGLALFLTIFIMKPTFREIESKAVQPYVDKQITGGEAIRLGSDALKQFMLRHTRKNDLALFLHLSGEKTVPTPADTPFLTLVPAFVISELKTAFVMGFCIFLPFLMVDLVVSSVLTSMGMVMMPPATIAAPFKILLFVLADGWHLVSHAIAASYG
jgi:flagellar biosynthesis protein FliP